MTLVKVIRYLSLLFLFLIPLQTRWRYYHGSLNGGYWEYGTFAIYGTELLLWLIAILYAFFLFYKKHYIKEVINKKRLKQNGFSIIIFLLFVVLNIINIFLSIDIDISYQHFIRLLSVLCISVILINTFYAKKDRILALTVFWASAIVQGLLAIYQFLTQGVFASSLLGMSSQNPANFGVGVIEYIDERWMRAYGTLTGPNPLGAYLAVLFFIGIMLYFNYEKKVHKQLIVIGQIIILIGIVLSFSRAAWLALILGSIVLLTIILTMKGDKNELLKQYVHQMSVYVIVGLLCVVVLAPLFVARFTFTNTLEHVSITERKIQIQQSSRQIKRNVLFGSGAGTYTLQAFKNNPNYSSWRYQPVHNAFLLMIAESGALISIILFAFYGWVIKMVWNDNRVYISVLVVLAVVAFFEHWTWSLYSGLLFWFVSIFLGLYNSQRIEK